MKSINVPVILVSLLVLILSGCGPSKEKKNVLAVSILPQKYFVERIVGNNWKITVMVPPGHSPATYDPSPGQIAELSKAKAYFRIGPLPFEKAHMDRLRSVNRDMKVIDTSRGVSLIHGDHHHGEKQGNHSEPHKHGDHHHGEDTEGHVNPHIWLSPTAVSQQVDTILDAMVKLDPDNASIYRKNAETFQKDITALDSYIASNLEKVKNRKFIVFHPAWSYYARDYGLIQVPIEVEGKKPGPAQIQKVIDAAKNNDIHAILVQKQFPTDTAGAIARDIDGNVVNLDPLAENWLENMKEVTGTFVQILGTREQQQ
jgi:zinc transport system substrate-binding protein